MLKIENISKQYKAGRFRKEKASGEVLQNVSFDVETGDFVSIVGPSGCGKTTLINLIMGLDKPDSGAIYIDGEKVTGVDDDRALVFQENALFPWLTVEENVELGLRVKGFKRQERRRIAAHYLNITGMLDSMNCCIHQLSGGMKQRVAIARALAIESKILVMDEPFGALDASTKASLHSEILKIWKETGKTVIFVTHDIEEAVKLSKKVIVMGFAPDNIKEIIDIPLGYPREENDETLSYIHRIKAVIARSTEQ